MPSTRKLKITGRMPYRSISRPETGPAKPRVRIESESAQEISAVLQPKSPFSGVIMTPGADRMPAVTSTSMKVTPTITHA